MSFPHGLSCKVFNEAIVVQAWTIYADFSLFSHRVFRRSFWDILYISSIFPTRFLEEMIPKDDQSQGQARIRVSVRISLICN